MVFHSGRSRNLVASLLARARLVTALLILVIVLVLVHLVEIFEVNVLEIVAELKRLDCDLSQLGVFPLGI